MNTAPEAVRSRTGEFARGEDRDENRSTRRVRDGDEVACGTIASRPGCSTHMNQPRNRIACRREMANDRRCRIARDAHGDCGSRAGSRQSVTVVSSGAVWPRPACRCARNCRSGQPRLSSQWSAWNTYPTANHTDRRALPRTRRRRASVSPPIRAAMARSSGSSRPFQPSASSSWWPRSSGGPSNRSRQVQCVLGAGVGFLDDRVDPERHGQIDDRVPKSMRFDRLVNSASVISFCPAIIHSRTARAPFQAESSSSLSPRLAMRSVHVLHQRAGRSVSRCAPGVSPRKCWKSSSLSGLGTHATWRAPSPRRRSLLLRRSPWSAVHREGAWPTGPCDPRPTSRSGAVRAPATHLATTARYSTPSQQPAVVLRHERVGRVHARNVNVELDLQVSAGGQSKGTGRTTTSSKKPALGSSIETLRTLPDGLFRSSNRYQPYSSW